MRIADKMSCAWCQNDVLGTSVVLHIVYVCGGRNAVHRLLNICNSRACLVVRVLKIRVKKCRIFRVFATGGVSDGIFVSF